MTTAREGVRGQRHAPAVLYPRERAGTHCTGGWVGPRAGHKTYFNLLNCNFDFKNCKYNNNVITCENSNS